MIICKDSLMILTPIYYHLSTCKFLNNSSAAPRVNNLKPHWVSLMPLTQKNQTTKWKPIMRMVRKKDLWGERKCRFMPFVLLRCHIAQSKFSVEIVLMSALNLSYLASILKSILLLSHILLQLRLKTKKNFRRWHIYSWMPNKFLVYWNTNSRSIYGLMIIAQYIIQKKKKLTSAIDSFSKCALDPQTTATGPWQN